MDNLTLIEKSSAKFKKNIKEDKMSDTFKFWTHGASVIAEYTNEYKCYNGRAVWSIVSVLKRCSDKR